MKEICPKCGSTETHKNGRNKTKGGTVVRYYCRSCGKTFQVASEN